VLIPSLAWDSSPFAVYEDPAGAFDVGGRGGRRMSVGIGDLPFGTLRIGLLHIDVH
jgi:hypothetical protein